MSKVPIRKFCILGINRYKREEKKYTKFSPQPPTQVTKCTIVLGHSHLIPLPKTINLSQKLFSISTCLGFCAYAIPFLHFNIIRNKQNETALFFFFPCLSPYCAKPLECSSVTAPILRLLQIVQKWNSIKIGFCCNESINAQLFLLQLNIGNTYFPMYSLYLYII